MFYKSKKFVKNKKLNKINGSHYCMKFNVVFQTYLKTHSFNEVRLFPVRKKYLHIFGVCH